MGIFPDVAAVERLVGALLMDIDDEWQVDRRYFSQELMRKLYSPEEHVQLTAALHLEPIHQTMFRALQGRYSFYTT